MNYLGIDYGEKRIGLAFGDEVGVAYPLPAATADSAAQRLCQIEAAIQQRRVHELVVGYPFNMDDSIGYKAREVDAFIERLQKRFGLPVHRADERLTTRQARAPAPKGRTRNSLKKTRRERASGNLDSRAAAIFLQDFLEERVLAGHAQSAAAEDAAE